MTSKKQIPRPHEEMEEQFTTQLNLKKGSPKSCHMLHVRAKDHVSRSKVRSVIGKTKI